jgi:copper chaperone
LPQVALEPARSSGKMICDREGEAQMTRLSIPDMSCSHCKATVTTALTALPGVASVEIDLDARMAEVAGDAALSSLLAALQAAGYPARPA